MPNFTDIVLTAGSGGSHATWLVVGETDGKAFVLYDNWLDISSVDVVGETELLHVTLVLTGVDQVNNNLTTTPAYTVGVDGFVYAIGQNTSGGFQSLYKIDPTTLLQASSVAIPVTAGSPFAISGTTFGVTPYIAIAYNEAITNNVWMVVIDGTTMTVVGTCNMGSANFGSPFTALVGYPIFDDANNVWVVSNDGTANGYLTKVLNSSGYTTQTQYTIPATAQNTIPTNAIYDAGTNSLFVLFDNADLGADNVAEIAQYTLSGTPTGLNVGAFPASPAFDINYDAYTGLVAGSIIGQRGHTMSGTFYLSDFNSDTFNPGGSFTDSGDLINPWTASTLTKGTQVNLSAYGPGGGAVAWTGPRQGSVSNGFYNNGGTIKYMFLPRGTGLLPGSLPEHFYITPLPTPAIPILTLSGNTLTFNATYGGGNPASQTINLTNTGTGVLNYNTGSDAAWLTVTPPSGSAPQLLTFHVVTSGLSAGSHVGHILVTAPGATGSPQTVTVTFNVAQAPTNVALVAAPNPATSIQGITLTATVVSSVTVNQGTVTFYDGVGILGTIAVDLTGHAVLTVSALPTVGVHHLSASYTSSGGNFGDHTSLTFDETITSPSTATLPGLGLITSYSTQGDEALPPEASLVSFPALLTPGQQVSLIWSTFNVPKISITDSAAQFSLPVTTNPSQTGGSVLIPGGVMLISDTFILHCWEQDGVTPLLNPAHLPLIATIFVKVV